MEPDEQCHGVELERSSEEWFFALKGEIEFQLADSEPHRLGPDDTIDFTSGRLVLLRCVSAEALEPICMIAPPAL